MIWKHFLKLSEFANYSKLARASNPPPPPPPTGGIPHPWLGKIEDVLFWILHNIIYGIGNNCFLAKVHQCNIASIVVLYMCNVLLNPFYLLACGFLAAIVGGHGSG